MENTPTKNLPDNRFINRELSWIAFNERVLEEALNKTHPLLERLKFLAISGSNLDEFFMVRVAGIRNQIRHNVTRLSNDGLSPSAQLSEINLYSDELVTAQQECWEILRHELAGEGIAIISPYEYSDEDVKWLKNYFASNIQPHLTPVITDSADSAPLIPNLAIALIAGLQHRTTNRKAYTFLILPDDSPRFIRLADRGAHSDFASTRFTLVEDIVRQFMMEHFFADYELLDSAMVRVVRDSELDISDEGEDLVMTYESALERRQRGHIVRLRVSAGISPQLGAFIEQAVGVDRDSITHTSDFVGLSDLSEIYDAIDQPEYKFPPLAARFPERIDDFDGDCFAAIQAKDIIVHHPYESFDVVVQFIRQAAHDPDVVEIRQTLYRTSSDSAIVKALIEAAEAGKKVTVVVEPKARFDEAANIRWGKGLQQAGARVVFGVAGLKTHAKISLITRQIGDITQQYVHYGTGNYHPVTAKVYSDLSFFTCDTALCRDAEKLFAYMEAAGDGSGSLPVPDFEKIYVSPFTIRKKLLSLIENEIAYAKKGRYASIWIKVNSLVDSELIDALYRASCAGVSVELVVRGICSLRPGVAGLSENIRVKSIVGRFLEHARIYCFGDGHALPSSRCRLFISSADWMPRNMNRRIELMVPVENPTVHEQVVSQIMVANMRDRKQSWSMQNDGFYRRHPWSDTSFSAHEFFISNPSLSGRGSALHGEQEELRGKQFANSFSRVAVLDIGSNSVRLVIYDGLKRVPLPLFNEKVLCALARNLEKTGRLNKKGVKLALESIRRFAHIVKAMDIRSVYCFATSAVRDAADGDEFVREVEQISAIKVDILSGEEEARLAVMGVAAAFYEAEGLVGDLGGGSLELAQINYQPEEESKEYRNTGIQARIQARIQDIVGQSVSFPLGPLRLQIMAKGQRNRAYEIIDEYLTQFPLEETLSGRPFYAVGGGWRAIAKIHMKRSHYPLSIIQSYEVSPQDFLDTLEYVSSLPPSKIRRLPGVSEDREETLAFSALVMERIIEIGRPDSIFFSTYGVREGMIFDQLPPETAGGDALIAGCSDMIASIVRNDGVEWVEYGRRLADWMSPLFDDETPHMVRLRLAACILSRIAWYENRSYRAEAAFRWVLDSELPAIDHWERIFLATAVYHRYRSRVDGSVDKIQSLLQDKWIKRARIIGFAMRLGYHMSGSSSELLAHTSVKIHGKKLVLTCNAKYQSLLGADIIKRLEKLARELNKKTEVRIRGSEDTKYP